MQERLEQMTEELRKLEQARELLRELEGRLRRGDDSDLEDHLTRLEQLGESFAEGHMARLLVESAVGNARARRAGKAYSDVSRSRSAIEGGDLDAPGNPQTRDLLAPGPRRRSRVPQGGARGPSV